MAKKSKPSSRSLDYRLSSSLTGYLTDALLEILKKDPSEKARYLQQHLLSKFLTSDANGAVRRQQLAIEKWLAVELHNASINRGFSDSLLQPVMTVEVASRKGRITAKRVSLGQILDRARKVIHATIGDSPSLDPFDGSFSGGASTSKKREHGHPAVKFLDKADITAPCQTMFADMIRDTLWAENGSGLDPRVVRGNVLFTVPKNSEIDRVAAKEPDLNMFMQKGFGNQIRKALRRRGIDLNDQSRNQELSRIGSLTKAYATIDLSSASDTLSRELVRYLLPASWYHYLDTVRSHETKIGDVWHRNEMFSSMGNGATFELESLVFYSLARAVSYFEGVRGVISVYGDDIIVPTRMAASLIASLEACGFKPNESKSFISVDDPIRESCGKHWYNGFDVTPFYVRGELRHLSDLILFGNQLTSWASREIGVVDPLYEGLLLEIREKVPAPLWGGQDLTSRGALVTGHKPRQELFPTRRPRRYDTIGGLLYWLHTSERTPDRLEAIEVLGDGGPGIVRYRRHQAVGDVPVFLGTQLLNVDGSAR